MTQQLLELILEKEYPHVTLSTEPTPYPVATSYDGYFLYFSGSEQTEINQIVAKYRSVIYSLPQSDAEEMPEVMSTGAPKKVKKR